MPTATSESETVIISRKSLAYINWLLDEAEAQDALIKSLENENKLLSDRIETEKEKNSLLTQLNETRKKEADFWKSADAENKNVIALKDEQVANNEKEIDALKKKKVGILTQLKAFSYGVGAGVLLRSLL